MSDLLDLPATPADAVGFEAAAFDRALAEQRRRAAAGAYQASTEALEQLLQACPATELRRRADALTLLAQQYPRIGRLTASARCAASALGLAERLEDDGLVADALTAQSFVYGQLLMAREALEAGMRGLAAARRAGDAVREAWALNRVGAAYCSLENPVQACASTEQALEIAARAESAEVLFSCQNNLAYFWLRRVDDAAALRQAEPLAEAIAEARRAAEHAHAIACRSGSAFKVAVAMPK